MRAYFECTPKFDLLNFFDYPLLLKTEKVPSMEFQEMPPTPPFPASSTRKEHLLNLLVSAKNNHHSGILKEYSKSIQRENTSERVPCDQQKKKSLQVDKHLAQTAKIFSDAQLSRIYI